MLINRDVLRMSVALDYCHLFRANHLQLFRCLYGVLEASTNGINDPVIAWNMNILVVFSATMHRIANCRYKLHYIKGCALVL